MIHKIKEFISKFYKQKYSVFLIFVIGTSIFWFLNKLSKDYSQIVTHSISYTNLPNQYVFQELPTEKISFRVKANGFYFFSNAFRNKKSPISLKSVKKKSKYTYFLPTINLEKQVRSNLKDNIKLIEIEEDSLIVKLGKKSFKKVPVLSNLSLKYHVGYHSFTGAKLLPDSILISGPEMQLKKVNRLTLNSFKKENIMESIDERLEVIKPEVPKITLEVKQVQLKIEVEKITEKTLIIPIQVLNVPNNNVVIYPKKVKVTCQVRLSQFNEIDKEDFIIVCDYNKKQKKYIELKLRSQPSTVSSIKLHQNKVEYLILK